MVGDNAAQCTLRHYKERFNNKKKLFTNLTNSARMFQNIMKIAPTAYHHCITVHLSKSHQHSRTYTLTSAETWKKIKIRAQCLASLHQKVFLIQLRLTSRKTLWEFSKPLQVVDDKAANCTLKGIIKKDSTKQKILTNFLSIWAQILTKNLKIGAQCLTSLHQKAHLSSLSSKKNNIKKMLRRPPFRILFSSYLHGKICTLHSIIMTRNEQTKKKLNKPSIKQSSNIPKHYETRPHCLPTLHHSTFVKNLISLGEPQL